MVARLVFFGSPPFAIPALRALLASPFRPALVVSPPDRPRGRGLRVEPSEVARASEAAGVPSLRAERPPSPEEIVRACGGVPDLLVVVSYGAILPKALLDLPRLGAFNLHASLLPRHRGASPIQAAVLAGDEETGVTVQRMTERLDAGAIVLAQRTRIGERETAGELAARLAELGAGALARALEAIVEGRATSTPQDEALATRAPRLRKEDGRIDWGREAAYLDRFVRAMEPWPGAETEARGRRLRILEARAEAPAGRGPGTVVEAGEAGVLVACGEGALRLLRVKPQGRDAMTAGAFARGRGVAVGDVLGGSGGAAAGRGA